MKLDMSTASFEFRFEGTEAESDANAMFNLLPKSGSSTSITKRLIGEETIWFVDAQFDGHADCEYVRQVSDAISKFALRED